MTRYDVERWCAWSGLAGVILFFFGFLFSHFIPPLAPSSTVSQVAAHYRDNANGIRGGMVVMMVSGMFVAPMVGLIATHINRIPGITPTIASAQICAGTLNIVFFMVPALMFIATAYRPDRPADITYVMNDLSWITAVLPWPPAFMQNVAIAVAIFCDRGTMPIFPRWLAYLNLWVAIAYLPGGMLPFFKTGPFAWNGLMVFWLAASAFIIWFIAMTVVLLRIIGQAERDAVTAMGDR